MNDRRTTFQNPGAGASDQAAMTAAEKAQQTADNARQMVLNRDPRLATVEQTARDLQTIANDYEAQLTASIQDRQTIHGDVATLRQMVAQIQLTPGPPGKDGTPGGIGKDGPAGKDGTNGRDGLNGTNGKDGVNGTKGDPGTPADMTRVAALEAQRLQLEYRDGIAVPAVLSLLGIAATVDVAVTWATPFPDTAYSIVKPQTSAASASLIGKTDAVVKAGTVTKTGCTIAVTTTAVLALGTVTLSVLAYRKGN